jgi:cytochrome P450
MTIHPSSSSSSSSSCPFAALAFRDSRKAKVSIVPATGHPQKASLEKKFKDSYSFWDFVPNTARIAVSSSRVITGHVDPESPYRKGLQDGHYHKIATYATIPMQTRVVTDPDIADAIFRYPRDGSIFALSKSIKKIFDVFGGVSILTAPELQHEKLKTFAKKHFSSKAISKHADKIDRLAQSTIDLWQSQPDGKANNINTDLIKFSADVVMQSYLNTNDPSPKLASAIETLTKIAVDEIRNPLKWTDKTAKNEAQNTIHETVNTILTQNDPDEFLLQMFTEVNEDGHKIFDMNEIQGMCITLLIAGQDTMGHFLTYLLYILGRETQWQTALKEELKKYHNDIEAFIKESPFPTDTITDSSATDSISNADSPEGKAVKNPNLLSKVVNEALRLFPSVYNISRQAAQDLIINDEEYDPKGWGLDLSILYLNRDTRRWGDDVLAFNPERTPAAVGSNQYAFGRGIHRCLGDKFTNIVVRRFLAKLIANYSWKTLNENEIGVMGFLTLHMAEGVNIQLTRDEDTKPASL